MTVGDPRCVAEPAPGETWRGVHLSVTRREPNAAPIHCYACGGLIRRHRLWLVRAEGAFHLDWECLVAARSTWTIQADSDAGA